MSERRISRDDLESSLQGIQSELLGIADRRRRSLVSTLLVGVSVLVVVAYAFGRRSGRRRSGFIEIRR
jgi:hypothetical protein